jgi:hypothetical protein
MTNVRKPGRKHFHDGLQSECNYLLGRITRERLSHADYLNLRSAIFKGSEWERATATARGEALAYLRGGIEMLFMTGTIVWAHRIDGQWIVPSKGGHVDYARIERSAHIYADTDVEFYSSGTP